MKISVFASLWLLALTPSADVVQPLELDHQPFLEDFAAANGRVRLVAVLSPT